MNNVSLIGRLVFDPELKYVNDDRAVCTFCLAVSRNYRNKDGVIPTDFINIDIWEEGQKHYANMPQKVL